MPLCSTITCLYIKLQCCTFQALIFEFLYMYRALVAACFDLLWYRPSLVRSCMLCCCCHVCVSFHHRNRPPFIHISLLSSPPLIYIIIEVSSACYFIHVYSIKQAFHDRPTTDRLRIYVSFEFFLHFTISYFYLIWIFSTHEFLIL